MASRSAPARARARTGMDRPDTWTTASGSALRFVHHAGGCSPPKFDAITMKLARSGMYSKTTLRGRPERRPRVSSTRKRRRGPDHDGRPRVRTNNLVWLWAKARKNRTCRVSALKLAKPVSATQLQHGAHAGLDAASEHVEILGRVPVPGDAEGDLAVVGEDGQPDADLPGQRHVRVGRDHAS